MSDTSPACDRSKSSISRKTVRAETRIAAPISATTRVHWRFDLKTCLYSVKFSAKASVLFEMLQRIHEPFPDLLFPCLLFSRELSSMTGKSF